MIKAKTLKQRVSEISIYAFVAVTVVMFTSFTLYSIKKANVTEEKIQADLSLNLKNQVNLFLPSFLLPEQRQGMNVLLDRVKVDEELDQIEILKNESQLPEQFSHCMLDKISSVTCPSNDLSATAVIAPLTELNQNYGYIFKSKKNSSAASIVGVMQFAGIILLILGVTFLVIYFYITRLAARTLPIALDNLVKWLESEIHGSKSENIELHFGELEDLKSKITEVFDRYNLSRDQAIIGQVTSGIMHDIKTPLQSIVTAVHLVSEKELNSTKRLDRLENLFRMCTSNIPLIGEIIETTLDGNRNIQVHKTQGNLRDTVNVSLQNTKQLSWLRNVEVQVNMPSEVYAEYDSMQFTRVINNLLKNGIEAASDCDNIPAVVRLSVSMDSENVVTLCVEDSGNGFTSSPEKVFRAFGTTKTHGTGLGLLVTKKIIESHHGTIRASNSSIFGGAKMEVTLPLEVSQS